jgi:L-ascorbate metabolism protein UlaG (beta-lactamase superfamily)
MKLGLRVGMIFLVLAGVLALPLGGVEQAASAEKAQPVSDHFDGSHYFNPGVSQPPPGQEQRRGGSGWIWRWIVGNDWPEWPEPVVFSPGPPPDSRVPKGTFRVTPVGHATFLVQIDSVNILIDPIWSERCSPVSWAGPRRHRAPGIRFEDLPPIDAVLISHNHYDHLDLPTLERLARKRPPRAVVPLGNLELVRSAGIPAVEALDWWQSVPLSADVTVTLVPARHFSSRTLWDRNRTLWGGFVVSGPSGNVYYAGDTGYGPHFREIARRFAPLRMAILPISPFRPMHAGEPPGGFRPGVHMGPAEAVEAHLDLGAQVSVAAHFQVFQLGPDGFDDAVTELASMLKVRDLRPNAFIVPLPGRTVGTERLDVVASSAGRMQGTRLGLGGGGPPRGADPQKD